MTNKQKDDAATTAYLRGFECGQDASKARIAALEAALDEILNYIGGANNALEDEYVMERARAARAAYADEARVRL